MLVLWSVPLYDFLFLFLFWEGRLMHYVTRISLGVPKTMKVAIQRSPVEVGIFIPLFTIFLAPSFRWCSRRMFEPSAVSLFQLC